MTPIVSPISFWCIMPSACSVCVRFGPDQSKPLSGIFACLNDFERKTKVLFLFLEKPCMFVCLYLMPALQERTRRWARDHAYKNICCFFIIVTTFTLWFPLTNQDWWMKTYLYMHKYNFFFQKYPFISYQYYCNKVNIITTNYLS
jgi:hypothetical protein